MDHSYFSELRQKLRELREQYKASGYEDELLRDYIDFLEEEFQRESDLAQ